jgi:NADH-quinone oxidoreductase subunit L
MGALFLASNLFQMYIMWELIGLISYLYVGFKYTNPLKSFASLKVFLINRVGDVAFLAGLVCLAYIMTAYSTPQFVTLDFSDFNFISAVVYAHTNPTTFLMLCLMFLFVALFSIIFYI